MAQNFIKIIERDLDKNHLSQHPFYQLWNEGKLSKKALQAYAQQYYHFVAHFPRLVAQVYANTPKTEDRLAIQENLIEEDDPKYPHDQMWEDFAKGIGVKIVNAEMLPETRKMLKNFKELCSKDFAQGSAALLAYESQVSDIAELKMKGLKKFYNVKNKKTLHFFKVHGKVDIEHQKTWKKLIAKYAKTKKHKAEIRRSANEALRSMWQLLDGVYRVYC